MSSVVSKEVVSYKEAASYLSFGKAMYLGFKIYILTALVAAVPAAIAILLTMGEAYLDALLFGLFLIAQVYLIAIVPACIFFAAIYLVLQRINWTRLTKTNATLASLLTVLASFITMYILIDTDGYLDILQYAVSLMVYLGSVAACTIILSPKTSQAHCQSLKKRYENIF